MFFVKVRPHYSQQSHRSMISTERTLAFSFQWLDSVTRLLKASARFSQEGVKLDVLKLAGNMHEWRASCLIWDVDPIVYLPPTTEKEKVLLPPPRKLWRHCDVHSTQESASATCKCSAHDTDAQQLWFYEPQFFFVFGFQPKATRAGDEKHRKKSTWFITPSHLTDNLFFYFQ